MKDARLIFILKQITIKNIIEFGWVGYQQIFKKYIFYEELEPFRFSS